MKNLRKSFRIILGVIGLVLVFWLFFSLLRFSFLKNLGKSWELKDLINRAKEEEKKGEFYKAIEYLEKIDENFGRNKMVYLSWLRLALLYEKTNRLLEAKKILERVISQCDSGEIIQEAQKNLGNLNIKIILSPIVTENDFVYEVKEGDSLAKIAQHFNTTLELLKRANNLKEESLRAGARLKVTKYKFSVLVDKSQNTLTLKADDKIVKIYTVSTGLNNVTPVGNFKIINRIVNPVWYKEGRAIPPGDPENILGSYWLGISQKGYGIHGTTQPETIGKHITQGCIRMYNQDVEELYILLPLGTEVTIME
ncbi:MAG: L,D-transpeptidase family protein [Candidatus Omnitrophica bacterium]|nr:L,D-transpeptidase family protein [Candidatus Omnitrophota bacterium]MCM8793853.1 L,D-transpeptidase family protein [Candidatus Omnitrophota bacterium]